MTVSDETWERSLDFARPWTISDVDYDTRYGRTSKAVVDASGRIVLFLDPSDDEYHVACEFAAAEEIVKAANR